MMNTRRWGSEPFDLSYKTVYYKMQSFFTTYGPHIKWHFILGSKDPTMHSISVMFSECKKVSIITTCVSSGLHMLKNVIFSCKSLCLFVVRRSLKYVVFSSISRFSVYMSSPDLCWSVLSNFKVNFNNGLLFKLLFQDLVCNIFEQINRKRKGLVQTT